MDGDIVEIMKSYFLGNDKIFLNEMLNYFSVNEN